jgi:hypothetical protein
VGSDFKGEISAGSIFFVVNLEMGPHSPHSDQPALLFIGESQDVTLLMIPNDAIVRFGRGFAYPDAPIVFRVGPQVESRGGDNGILQA